LPCMLGGDAGSTRMTETPLTKRHVAVLDASEAEMTEYRRPYPQALDRWPTLTWPRQIPISGEPAEIVQVAGDYAQWMAGNVLPKLFVNADPGAILIGAPRDFCRSWKNQTEVTVSGSHFIQEDSGPAIGRAVADWIKANSL
jgi:haloalkane dehalogenase